MLNKKLAVSVWRGEVQRFRIGEINPNAAVNFHYTLKFLEVPINVVEIKVNEYAHRA
jgi:hypothetical protein